MRSAAPDDGDDVALLVVREKIFEADAEHQCDAQERGQRRKKLAALDLGKHGRGKARVAAQFDESHLLSQAQEREFSRRWNIP